MKYIPNIPKVSMPTIAIASYLPPSNEDKLAKDEEAKRQRQEILKRQEWNTFFGGIAREVFLFLIIDESLTHG